MDAAIERVRRDMRACAPAARRSASSTTYRWKRRVESADQPGREPVGARAVADRGPAVRSSVIKELEMSDPLVRPRAQPRQRWQGRAHPDSGSHGGAPQGAFRATCTSRPRGAQRRPSVRRDANERLKSSSRSTRSQKTMSGRPRARAEDDRRSRQTDRRLQKRRTRPPRALTTSSSSLPRRPPSSAPSAAGRR